MSRPISKAQLANELGQMLRRAGLDPGTATIEFPDRLDAEHAQNPRRYAEVLVGKRAFRFARATLWLPQAQRRGLLAHEVGHVLTPGGTELDADMAAWEHLGVKITYDRRWPGKGLQTAG
jgi:hypothetical protein